MRVQADSVAYVATGVARRMLGVSRQRLCQLEAEGKISGQKVGGRWLWQVRSIESRIALLEKEGRRSGNDW